jgi:hypothetical protein
MSGLAQRDAVFFRGDLQTIMPPLGVSADRLYGFGHVMALVQFW